MSKPTSERIKVVYVINDLLLGGTQSILFDIVNSIDPARYEREVWYLDDHKNGESSRPDLVQKLEVIGVSPKNLRIRSIMSGIFALKQELKKAGPDIVHLFLPDSVIIGTFAARLAGIRSIIIHEQNTHHFYSRKLDMLFEFARRFTALTITYSEMLEDELFGDHQLLHEPLPSIERRSYTVHNGIDLKSVDETKVRVSHEKKREELGIKNSDTLIFTAARLVDWKGHEYLLRAFARVADIFPDARLLIAGEGPQQNMLEKLISEFGLGGSVRLLGPRSDVFEILAVSDIYPQAYAYPEDFSSISIGMAGMEAMAFSLPIVASRYPALYDGVVDKENALLVEPRDIDGIAQALEFLLRDQAARKRIGSNARQFVRTYFSAEKNAHIYESLYTALVNKYV